MRPLGLIAAVLLLLSGCAVLDRSGSSNVDSYLPNGDRCVSVKARNGYIWESAAKFTECFTPEGVRYQPRLQAEPQTQLSGAISDPIESFAQKLTFPVGW